MPMRYLSSKGTYSLDNAIRLTLIAVLLAVTPGIAAADPAEYHGRVSSVAAGDTFTVDGFGQVHLADVQAPTTGTADAVHSKEYALENVLNVQVFLDVDNVTGYRPGGTTECLVYLSTPDGQPNLDRLFNRMIVDAGYARISNDTRNEFDPADW